MEFKFRGERLPLLDSSRGIRNPADFDATLSIMTSADKRRNPYADVPLGDGLVRYSYQAADGGDNKKLRAAAERRVPVVYFEQKFRSGPFYAHFPMYVHYDTGTRSVTLAFDDDVRFQIYLSSLPPEERRYAERKAIVRLHQDRFRDLIMTAYEERCSVCYLGHARLLDAAHITPDGDV
ncbi:MAG: HNH endonuclease, partial [Microbacteriaceae bacterium]